VIAEDTSGAALINHQVRIIVDTATNQISDIVVEEL
jgi:hypothetical protein